MDLRRLEVFCKVVELKSFTKAGKSLTLSQPTVSEHIRSLESMLGERLVNRLGREALPTAAGRILYQYARKIIEMRDEAFLTFKKHRNRIASQVNLGASSIPGNFLLPELLNSFRSRNPSVRFALRIAAPQLIAAEILQGEIELGFVEGRWTEPALEWAELIVDELVLVFWPHHSWAGKASVTFEELTREPLILLGREGEQAEPLGQILTRYGFDPTRLDVCAEMNHHEAVRQSVKAELGVAFLPRLTVVEDLDRGTLLAAPLAGMRWDLPFYVIHHKKHELSPLCSSLRSHLHSFGPTAHRKP